MEVSLKFKHWLEDTGKVAAISSNDASEDGFSYIRSKYISGKQKYKGKRLNLKKIFGKK